MTDGVQPPSKFASKLAEWEANAARKAAEEKGEVSVESEFDADLVPEHQTYTLTEADKEMDAFLGHIGILDAYRKWCGKMNPGDAGNRTEGIMISCPNPTHRDTNPSAWANTEKNTWYCGTCEEGGDVHEIAAWHFGYPVPGYKEPPHFHEMRVKMAEDLGFKMISKPGGVVEIVKPIILAEEPKSDPESIADVVDLYDDEDINVIMPSLDWKPLVPEDTFLWEYMNATIIDDVPEEYHFFHALMAIGFALGREVRLDDLIPVYGNLFVCTLGRSGAGKSKARYHLDQLLARALPHDWTDPLSKGVRKISSPGSAEVLIHNFQKPVSDPSDPKKIMYNAPVRGMVDFNEFSSLIARTSRQGSALTPTLMQFYDMEAEVATSSMTTGAKTATEPFASALTTTQPRSLRNLFSKSDDVSGFLNRWLFIPGTEKKKFAIGGARVDITPAVAPLERIAGWAGSFGPDEYVEWSDEAAAAFTHFFHARIEPDKKTSDNDLITRIDLTMKKLILLFSANLHQRLVTKEAVEAAIACYQYIYDSYQIPAGQLGNTLSNEVMEAVMHQVRSADAKGMTLSMSDISKRLKRRKYPMDLLIKTVDNLVKLDYLSIETSKIGAMGRPTTRYKYVD